MEGGVEEADAEGGEGEEAKTTREREREEVRKDRRESVSSLPS